MVINQFDVPSFLLSEPFFAIHSMREKLCRVLESTIHCLTKLFTQLEAISPRQTTKSNVNKSIPPTKLFRIMERRGVTRVKVITDSLPSGQLSQKSFKRRIIRSILHFFSGFLAPTDSANHSRSITVVKSINSFNPVSLVSPV